MLLKLSNLNSNLAQTLGYLNPALKTSALDFKNLLGLNLLVKLPLYTNLFSLKIETGSYFLNLWKNSVHLSK